MRYRGVELHSDESVKLTVRQYAARLVIPFAVSFLVLIAAFFLFIPLWNLKLLGLDLHKAGQAIFFLLIGFAIAYFWRGYALWSDTALIVTDQRVIDVDRRGLFDRVVSEVPYSSLSDVSYRCKGIIEMTAGVGSITFQMFSGSENICFHNILNPGRLHKEILELRMAAERGVPESVDPMEETLARVKRFSPTEQRALLASLKKTVPKKAPFKINDDENGAS